MIFINSNSEFHLQNKKISYIFNVLKNGQLGHLYFGKKIKHRESFSHLYQENSSEVALSPNPIETAKGFSLDLCKQEFPSFGTGDFREPSIKVLQENGSRVTNFTYSSYEVIEGKPSIKGLPSTYSSDPNKAKTLVIKLVDELIKCEIYLNYTIYENSPIITRSVKIINRSKDELNLEKILSMSIDFSSSNYDLITFDGAWARERHINRRRLSSGKFTIDSKRGCSSSNHNPSLLLCSSQATETSGEAYGFNLIYSGNFIGEVEVNHYDSLRVNMGINPFDFNWLLEAKQEFQTPEVILSYSSSGFNSLSQSLHSFFKNNLIRGELKNRPILINNWEATYFNFSEEKLLNLAKKGASLGMELFVLDDGWFGKRDNDYTGLGDWFENLDKIPSGISGLAKKINNLGLEFGLWIEPEMVNPNSKLYKEHPDWVIQTPNRHKTLSRNQLVLDFSREDVRDYIYNRLSHIFSSANISYIKWDMNRVITEAYSTLLPENKQKEIYHRYILGLYSLIEKLTSNFPHILFESCASGGNRFDLGMLYYMPQGWLSDDTDPVERLKIKYGSSYIYPLNSMGAHVSASPNHQTGRHTSLSTRGDCAFYGAFGYELDLTKLEASQEEIIKKQINFYKKYRQTFLNGKFSRILSPFTSNNIAWSVEDDNYLILTYYEILSIPNSSFFEIKLTGLGEEKTYQIIHGKEHVQGEEFYGDELMNIGLKFRPISVTDPHEIIDLRGDFKSKTIVFQKGTLDG